MPHDGVRAPSGRLRDSSVCLRDVSEEAPMAPRVFSRAALQRCCFFSERNEPIQRSRMASPPVGIGQETTRKVKAGAFGEK
mmetsp:Transcript_28285/g.43178  ORF Transcript_28285/g.43178 Transcript_28285/m.43178 type:complete len:81 (-) Transcript_28285:828-1070(-)